MKEMPKPRLGLFLSLIFSSRRRSSTGDAFLLVWSHDAFVSKRSKNKSRLLA